MLRKLIKRLIPGKIKTWAKDKIQQLMEPQVQTAFTRLKTESDIRLANLERKTGMTHGALPHEPNLKITSCSYINSPWWQPNFWEPAVQLALRDLITPGTTVFDVGANLAGLSILMSRLTGPAGSVCAFEASPRIIELTQGNIIASGCSNIHLYHNAVFSESGQEVMVFAGGHLNDSLFHQGEFQEQVGKPVRTLALDDFVRHQRLKPDLVKMDIEGAEFDALLGFQNTITECKPHLILETSPRDMRCWDLLTQNGYSALDLSSYGWIQSAADFPPGSEIRNVLYIHETRLGETPYGKGCIRIKEFEAGAEQFQLQSENWYSIWITLQPGRFVVEFDLEGNPKDEVMVGMETKGQEISRYHAARGFLAQHYREMPIHLQYPTEVRFFLKLMKGNSPGPTPPSWLSISRLADFQFQWDNPLNYLIA